MVLADFTWGVLDADWCVSPDWTGWALPPGSPPHQVLLSPPQAIDSRDSLAMALYARCFEWVIRKINSRIKGKDDFKSIGILDIFGFENFEVSFHSVGPVSSPPISLTTLQKMFSNIEFSVQIFLHLCRE